MAFSINSEYAPSMENSFRYFWYIFIFLYFIQQIFISRPSDSVLKRRDYISFKGRFLYFSSTQLNTDLPAAPQIPLCSEDAGIEPRTVATLALAVGRSIAARLDLIHREQTKKNIILWKCLFNVKVFLCTGR